MIVGQHSQSSCFGSSAGMYSQSRLFMGPLSTEGEGQKSDFPPRASRVVLPYELRTFYFHSWVALILRLSGVRNVVQPA